MASRVEELYEGVARIDERTLIMHEQMKDQFERGTERMDKLDDRVRSNQVAVRWLWGVGVGGAAVLGFITKVL